jgi:hypothetical protein
MSALSKPVAAFYIPGPPPLPLPLLIVQTDLSIRLPLVLAQVQLRRPDTSPYAKRDSGRGVIRPLKSIRREPREPSRSLPHDDLSDLSDLSSLPDVDSDCEDDMVAKPSGEPGRPGRGGYNLQTAVNWSPERFNKLKVKLPCLIPSNPRLNLYRHLYIRWLMNTLIPRKHFQTKNQILSRPFVTL